MRAMQLELEDYATISLTSVPPDLSLFVPAVVLLQANAQANCQCQDNYQHKQENEAYPPPSSSLGDIFVVPHIRQLLPFRARDIPEAVLGRRLLEAMPGRIAKSPASTGYSIFLGFLWY